MFRKKKGQVSGGIVGTFAAVIGIAFILLILGIFQAYSADIVTDVQADFDANSYAYNISEDNLAANDNLSEKQGTLTNIAIAVVIISLLLIAAAVVGIRIATG
jgi:hypothetical protein